MTARKRVLAHVCFTCRWFFWNHYTIILEIMRSQASRFLHFGLWIFCLDCRWEKGQWGSELTLSGLPKDSQQDRQKVYCIKDESCKGCSCVVEVCRSIIMFVIVLFHTNNCAANAIKLSAIAIITNVGEQWCAVNNIAQVTTVLIRNV